MTDTVDNIQETASAAEPLSTPLTIGVEAYLSEDYARAEGDKLWAKVWQQVGRVEELVKVGDFLTYDILDDSIIVVRTGPDTIRAYHNVCSHRGRKLVDTPDGAARRAAAPSSSCADSTAGVTTSTGTTRSPPNATTGTARSPTSAPGWST